MNSDDISIDLETLDVRPSAAVLAIGAQRFDINSGQMGETFYAEIDVNSAVKSGTISGDTLAWWMRQGSAARQIFHEDKSIKKPLSVALDEFSQWVKKSPAARFWFNGPAEDAVWLLNAYEKGCVGLQAPWQYNRARDLRTLADLPGVAWPSSLNNAMAHHALHDATYQAKVISNLWRQVRALRSTVKPPPEQYHQPDEDDEL